MGQMWSGGIYTYPGRSADSFSRTMKPSRASEESAEVSRGRSGGTVDPSEGPYMCSQR